MRQISMVAKVTDIKGIGPAKAETLAENGYESVEDLADADPEELADVDGVGDDRALEFIVGAEDVLAESQNDSEQPEESSGESFDLTPSEVSEELDGKDDVEIEAESEDDSEDEPAEDEKTEVEQEGDPTFTVKISFASRMEYDVFHAALMRYYENIYTSHQPSADAMEKCLERLYGNEHSVSFELTEYELNTLHTATKQQRTSYQGDNLIDQMDALRPIEEQIDDTRRAELF